MYWVCEDQIMAKIPLQSGIIYGPVFSRRFGRSMGINLLPVDRKLCSFDCLYCEYGFTQRSALSANPSPRVFARTEEVVAAVKHALRKPRTIETLTFSGNGEPTLHPEFLTIVREVKKLRDRLRPSARLAVLSNSSRVNDPSVIEGLNLLDASMMKLDAGDPETFQALNRPAAGIAFEAILRGLEQLHHLMIQSVLVNGEVSNIHGEAYQAWVAALRALQPCMTHIYSLDRPAASPRVKQVSPIALSRIAEDLTERFNLPVEAFWRGKRAQNPDLPGKSI
jgi:wyosine [tRNA(Phe)-imidazoG37] synthetase (radical SAM superfamily)